MVESIFFKIADHILLVNFPSDLNLKRCLPSFKDFVIDEINADDIPLLTVDISYDVAPEFKEELTVLADSSVTWGKGFAFAESHDYYVTTMRNPVNDSKIVMISAKDFRISTIYLGNSEAEQYALLSWFLMVSFGQSVLFFKTIMIHASTVERNKEEAYAFLGKSGTGKSTHSQLWLKYLEGFELLNDDNPVIRVLDDAVYIYGTPWSGKTDCYRNVKVRLTGIVRLRQAKKNVFQQKHFSESMIMLLPSCTAIRWNKKLFNNMVDTVESITNIIPVGLLDCLIDQEAASISYNGIKNKTLNYE